MKLEKKHILIVGMAPGFIGGTETFVMKMYNGLDKNKYVFDILLDVRDGEIAFEKEIKEYGGTIYRICYGIKKHPIKHFTVLNKFFKEHPEIVAVHANMTLIYDIDFLIAAKRAGVPVRIMHCHNTAYSDPQIASKYPVAYFLDRFNRKRISKYANKLYACSKDAGKWMFGNKRFEVVPITVDTSKFVYNEQEKNRQKQELGLYEKNIIGFIGRLAYQKNPEFAVNIFEQILSIDNSYYMIMIGKGDLEEQIYNLIEKKGISNNVMLIKEVDSKDVPKYMNIIDCLLMPSRFEGFPCVLVESQSMGIKCVVSDSITRDVDITNNIEYLSLNMNEHEWAEYIVDIMKSYKREDMSNILNSIGYDDRSMSKKMQKVYEGENVSWE